MRPFHWQFSKRPIERFCAGILILAVLFRAYAPASSVLAFSADGINSILVICTAQGTKIVADPMGGRLKPDDKPSSHLDCSTLCSPLAVVGGAEAKHIFLRYDSAISWPTFDFITPPVRAGPLLSIRGPPAAV